MLLLNAPDAPQRILKCFNLDNSSTKNLEFIAKHSDSDIAEVTKAFETFSGQKVPITLMVNDPEEANDIYLEAVKRKVKTNGFTPNNDNSPIVKTEAEPITPATNTAKSVLESRIKKLKEK